MMRYPDVAECFRLMEEYGMLPNIRRHSVIVARVARQLVEGLKEGGKPLDAIPDRGLTLAGALLHDIAKTPCLRNGCDHARAGGDICRRLGYPEVAEIVEEHVLLRDHDAERYGRGIFSAREIIYYADKRVRHEEIVSLTDRLDYILQHYGQDDPVIHRRIRENFIRCLELEQFLFTHLPFSPDQLQERLEVHPGGAPPEFLSLAAGG